MINETTVYIHVLLIPLGTKPYIFTRSDWPDGGYHCNSSSMSTRRALRPPQHTQIYTWTRGRIWDIDIIQLVV